MNFVKYIPLEGSKDSQQLGGGSYMAGRLSGNCVYILIFVSLKLFHEFQEFIQ